MDSFRRIYKIENKLNGKCYVGQTGQSLRRRFYGNLNQSIRRLIKELGRKNFIVELLEEVPLFEGDVAERKWIEKLNAYEPTGYNIREGGIRGRIAESTKQKLRGREVTVETRAKMVAAAMGKSISEKARESLELGRKLRWTEERKRASAGEGNPHSLLTKEKVLKIRELYASGFYSQQRLGEMFGVKQVTISKIITGKNWRLV